MDPALRHALRAGFYDLEEYFIRCVLLVSVCPGSVSHEVYPNGKRECVRQTHRILLSIVSKAPQPLVVPMVPMEVKNENVSRRRWVAMSVRHE